jgi:hypothetical protein
MTSREFIETAPLYTRVAISNFQPPDSIMRMCDSKNCRKETTWKTGGKFNTPERDISGVSYRCGLCGQKSVTIFYQMLDQKEHPGIGGLTPSYHSTEAVRKVGQVPAQEIEISPELSARLGDMADHYKKALICRSQNYGIGAMAYLRRVVDEKTDDLINVMIELSEAAGVDAKDIARLQAAKSEARYEDKLRVASELIPQAIKSGGVNPLGQLYKHTSIGLHNKTDGQCVAIFDDLRADFEFVFRNLHVQVEEQRQYSKRIQEHATRPAEKNT